MPFFTLYQAIIKMKKGGNRHRSKGGPKWAFFHQFWVAIFGTPINLWQIHRLRMIIRLRKLQFFADRLATWKKILGIAVLKRRRKKSLKVEKYETKVAGNGSSYCSQFLFFLMKSEKWSSYGRKTIKNVDFDQFLKLCKKLHGVLALPP